MDNFMQREGKRRFSVPMIVLMSVGGFILAAALALFFGWIVMLLWNWLMPTIFKLPAIDYWQGWGLVVLSHILIKPGFGHGGRGHGWGGRHGRGDWKGPMGKRFHKEEEAEKPTEV
jgi:hypothetical protein